MNGDYHLIILFETLSVLTLFQIWREMSEAAKLGDEDSLNVACLIDKEVSTRSKLELDWYVSSQLLVSW